MFNNLIKKYMHEFLWFLRIYYCSVSIAVCSPEMLCSWNISLSLNWQCKPEKLISDVHGSLNTSTKLFKRLNPVILKIIIRCQTSILFYFLWHKYVSLGHISLSDVCNISLDSFEPFLSFEIRMFYVLQSKYVWNTYNE